MGHNEMPCNTASHWDPCCLKKTKENISKFRKNPDKSGEMVGL